MKSELQHIDPVAQAGRLLQPAARANRVYVAGPMTGIAEHNFPAFNAAAASLRAAGWHVENPADHGDVPGAAWTGMFGHRTTVGVVLTSARY